MQEAEQAGELSPEVKEFCELVHNLNEKQSRAIFLNREAMVELVATPAFQLDVLTMRNAYQIPLQGFESAAEVNAWESSIGEQERASFRRDSEFLTIRLLKMERCFVDAVRHFLLFDRIGRIQANYSVAVDTKTGEVTIKAHANLRKDEYGSASQLANALLRIIKPKKSSRTQPTLDRDLQNLYASTEEVGGELDPEGPWPTPEEDRRTYQKHRTAKHRRKKRQNTIANGGYTSGNR